MPDPTPIEDDEEAVPDNPFDDSFAWEGTGYDPMKEYTYEDFQKTAQASEDDIRAIQEKWEKDNEIGPSAGAHDYTNWTNPWLASGT